MPFKIEKMPAFKVIGQAITTGPTNNAYMHDIPAFWQRVHQEHLIQKIPHKLYDDVVLGLYTDYSPNFSVTDGSYSLIIGTVVTPEAEVTRHMVCKEIPAGKYAVFTAQGPLAKAVHATWQEIWNCKEIRRSFANDFEWYDKKSGNDENSIVKIYVSIL